MNIGFDIDGVITDIEKFQLEEGKKYFKRNPINKNGFTVKEMFCCSSDEEKKFWLKNMVKYNLLLKPREDTKKMIKSLKKNGHNIYIITSRVFTDRNDIIGKAMKKVVKTWLKLNNIEYDDIIFTNDKKSAINEYHIDIMVEDSVKNIKELSKYTDVICLKSSYNEGKVNTQSVTNMKELNKAINKLIISKSKFCKDDMKPVYYKLSKDRPYTNYYNDHKPFFSPYMSMYNYVRVNNKHNMDGIALEYFGKKITYREFFKKIDEVLKAYINLGVKPGDVVTICMPNTPEAIISFYALNKMGAICNMIHPLSSVNEIKKYLNEVNSKYMLMVSIDQEKVNTIKNETNLEKVVVVKPNDSMPLVLKKGYDVMQGACYFTKSHKLIEKLEKNTKSGRLTIFKDNVRKLVDSSEKVYYDETFISWDEFINSIKNKNIKVYEAPYEKNKTAVIMHTGGTTGKSKGVMQSSEAFNMTNIQGGYSTSNYKRGDKWLTILPIFHGFGLSSAVHVPLSTGITAILIPQPNLKKIKDLIVKNQPNHLSAVPAFWEAMINDKGFDGVDLSYIKTLSSGGDAITPEKEMEINNFLRNHGSKAVVNNGFGMTETISAFTYPTDKNKIPGTVGAPMYGVDVKIVDPDTLEEKNPGEPGEMCVRGLNVMLGYYNNDEETKNALRVHDDKKVWLHTGDVASMDENGIITFVDRIKRMIIRNGYNVYSNEVEQVIEKIDDIDKCVVVGPKDEKRGQQIVTYVVLKDENKDISEVEREIKEQCMLNLAKYIKIDKIIPIKESDIPRTKTLKVDYRSLTDMAQSEIENNKKLVRK